MTKYREIIRLSVSWMLGVRPYEVPTVGQR